MPNRYLGRDLANQRYLGRDVSSIRSFGRIIYPDATATDEFVRFALNDFREAVPAIDVFSSIGGWNEPGTSLFDPGDPIVWSPRETTTTFASDPSIRYNTIAAGIFSTDRVTTGRFILAWSSDDNFGVFRVTDGAVGGGTTNDAVELEMAIAVGTIGSAGGRTYLLDSITDLLATGIELVDGVWRPRIIGPTQLSIFRIAVPRIDVLRVGSLSEGSQRIELLDGNLLTGTALAAGDNLSAVRALSAQGTGQSTFLTDRTPVGSFVLIYRNDQNFALYEVDAHTFGAEELDEVSLEAMVEVGTLGTGPAALYAFADTTAFLASVIEINGVWQPRDVRTPRSVEIITTNFVPGIGDDFTLTADTNPSLPDHPAPITYAWTLLPSGQAVGTGTDTLTLSSTGAEMDVQVAISDGDGNTFTDTIEIGPAIPITASVAYNATLSRYEATANGGNNGLNYAWTFDVQGHTFRLDRDTALPATTNADRQNLLATELNPTNLFPGDTVSNIGLRITDERDQELFVPITDVSNLREPIAVTEDVSIFLQNWRDTNGGFTIDINSPIDTVVTQVIIHSVAVNQGIDFSFGGAPSEYLVFEFGGIGHAATIFDPGTLHAITVADAIPFDNLNFLREFTFDIVGFGPGLSHSGGDERDIIITLKA